MKLPSIFGFYGNTDSGKTTLIEDIIKCLTQKNFKVATIKNSDKKIQIDQIGKDTWRHAKAGAEIISLNSLRETDLFIKKKLPLKDIIRIIAEIDTFDVILVEGAKEPSIPKIRVGDIQLRQNTIMDYKENTEKIIGLIIDEINKLKTNQQEIVIFVNEKKVPLSEFPASIIKSGITGMLQSLKGIETVKDVKIQFSIK